MIKETLRLWPPAGGGSRNIDVDDFKINDFLIPKGTHVMPSTYLCGRWNEYFPNPLEFKPERFLKEENNPNGNIKTYSYFPFSLGPRNCIGQNFAQVYYRNY